MRPAICDLFRSNWDNTQRDEVEMVLAGGNSSTLAEFRKLADPGCRAPIIRLLCCRMPSNLRSPAAFWANAVHAGLHEGRRLQRVPFSANACLIHISIEISDDQSHRCGLYDLWDEYPSGVLVHEALRLKPDLEHRHNNQPDRPAKRGIDHQAKYIDRALCNHVCAPAHKSGRDDHKRP